MMYRYDYEKYNTRELVEIWCFNGNTELTDKIECILKNRGIDLSAENLQKILAEQKTEVLEQYYIKYRKKVQNYEKSTRNL